MDCYFPWAEKYAKVVECNASQYLQVISEVINHVADSRRIYESLIRPGIYDTCSNNCHNTEKIYVSYDYTFEGHLQARYDTLISDKVAIRISPPESMTPVQNQSMRLQVKMVTDMFTISLVDGYPFSRLMSDVGSLVGSLVGFSLYSLTQLLS